ncbi:MAG: diguanylate cyclase [Gammaproteobacteria bacterium]|nr:diguanylate cyclase [Gammaproteobacteria bacterium]
MVAGTDRPEAINPGSGRKLLQLLSSLRNSPAGDLVYRQVEAILDEITSSHLKAEIAYASFLNVLLEAFNAHQTPGSTEYLQVKLLQARLQPPLTPTELDILGGFINQCGDQIRGADLLEPDVMLHAVAPLLAAFGIDAVAAPGNDFPEVESFADTVDLSAPSAADDAEFELADETSAAAALPDTDEGEAADISPVIPAGQDLNAINRSELEARRDDIEKLQATLADQVQQTIGTNEEFGVVLEDVLDDLREVEDVGELENMRWTIIREVEKMLSGHNDLADKLDSTHHYLQLFETDSRELSDELTRVRLLSLTDELTGLPNRRAFMRRLEDEVARVQRYGFPLSFVLIDLDHFKSINDDYGHAAGDEVLRVYSKNILSIFRHHDMVARYGGEEFAVLLPNTDSDGTVRALNKVRRRANETRWQINGTVADVPTFSAGVSLYKPGESSGAFIERADKALYRAKRLGRNRIELDMTYHKESSEDTPRRRSSDG